MQRGTAEVDARRMGSPAREGNGQEGRQARGVGNGVQAVPKAIVANSPARTTAAIGKPAHRHEHDQLQRLVAQKDKEISHYRDRAKAAEHKLKLTTVSRRFQ
ncbi:unnamed protein product [Laminaria digitata]